MSVVVTRPAVIRRKFHAEGRTRSQTVAVDRHGAFMKFDQVADNRQAHAEASTRATDRAARLRECLKDVREHLRRDPNAVVLDEQPNLAIVSSGAYRNFEPSGACLRSNCSLLGLAIAIMSQSESSNPGHVRRCLLCGGLVDCHSEARCVTTSCLECGAVLRIEFNPPDDPTLTARIERLDDVDDGGEDVIEFAPTASSKPTLRRHIDEPAA